MELLEAIHRRRSTRRYESRCVPPELLERILQAAVEAPFGSGLLAYSFVVVTDSKTKRALFHAALEQDWVLKAPLLVVVCADKRKSLWKGKDYSIIDASLACQNLMLAACDLGLATCFVGAFYDQDVRMALAIPGHIDPIGIITVGYPAENPVFYRRSWRGITFAETFGQSWEPSSRDCV